MAVPIMISAFLAAIARVLDRTHACVRAVEEVNRIVQLVRPVLLRAKSRY